VVRIKILLVAIVLYQAALLPAQDSGKSTTTSHLSEQIQDATKAAARDRAAQNSNQSANSAKTEGIPAEGSQRNQTESALLTDTGGVNFGPYMHNLFAKVQLKWHAAIPSFDYARYAKGQVSIECAVHRDGSVTEMKLTESSGDDAMDKAAWTGLVSSSPFAPLPPDFKEDKIRVRLRFHYNPSLADRARMRRAESLPPQP
jgi:TonB family protein